MGKGLWIASGIVIGVAVNLLVTHFASPSNAQQTQPQGGNTADGPVLIATGGSVANKNDVCWALFRDGKQKGEVKQKQGPPRVYETDRYILGCYRVEEGGKQIEIVDLRNVSWDVKLGVLPGVVSNHPPSRMFEDYVKANP